MKTISTTISKTIGKVYDRAEKAEARVQELESEIKMWHDALENGIFAIARSQVIHSMQKVIRGNDE